MREALAVALVVVASARLASAEDRGSQAPDPGQRTVERLQEYLRIDTTNPPGHEDRAVAFFARIFDAEGIRYETAESAPGRGNIWARLEGGPAPALILLHHMDVVPADRRHWTMDPLGGSVKDGDIYGRGTLDTKALGIAQLEAFLALHRSAVRLDRAVIFMATADEEAGGELGAGWIVAHRPEAFRGAGLLLTEGGRSTRDGGPPQFGVEVTQKVPLWLRLTATDRPSHGSTPRTSTSVTRLLRALNRLQTYEFAPRIVPAVDAYFKGLASAVPPRWRGAYEDIAAAVADPATLTALQIESPGLAALTRNTCSITRLEGSPKINVVPAEAHAELDCRLLPDQDRQAFLAEVTAVLNDPAITVETLMAFTPAVTATDTALYRAIGDVVHRQYADATVVPAVLPGFTDSHFFRDRGIDCYGFSPFLVPVDDMAAIHGNDERISIENVRRGTALMSDVVRAVAAAGR